MTALEIIRTLAKEFDSVDDATVKAFLSLTRPLVSKKRFGKLYPQALALLTAHRLKLAGHGEDTFGTAGDTLRVASYSEGETSVSFSSGQTGTQADSELGLTAYGLEYLALRRRVVIPIRSGGEYDGGI